jgi:hypothetical protein
MVITWSSDGSERVKNHPLARRTCANSDQDKPCAQNCMFLFFSVQVHSVALFAYKYTYIAMMIPTIQMFKAFLLEQFTLINMFTNIICSVCMEMLDVEIAQMCEGRAITVTHL